MKFNKDDERIIERILSGELSFSSKNIVNLEKCKTTEKEEETLLKLSDEIKSAVESNKELRKEVEKKIESAEKDPLNKIELVMIEEDIRDFNSQLNNIKSKDSKNIMYGAIATFSLGILLPLITSFFVSSLGLQLVFLLAGVGLGIVPCTIFERNLIKKRKKIKQEIRDLEQRRFELLGYEKGTMFISSEEKRKNVVKRIYAEKDLEISDEDMKSVF